MWTASVNLEKQATGHSPTAGCHSGAAVPCPCFAQIKSIIQPFENERLEMESF